MTALDDFFYFARVVEHGSYAQAGRALGIPKSRLSRHVSALEDRLGVRLVNRSTRRFVVTAVGRDVYQHAQAMLAEADAALEAAESARAQPHGVLKVSCPVALAQTTLARILPAFLAHYAKVQMQLDVTNRRVDVLSEGFDAALRVRARPSGEDGLVMRAFREFCELLVASPAYLNRAGRPSAPGELTRLATLDFAARGAQQTWRLSDASGASVSLEHTPRLVCHDFVVLKSAVLADLGVALLPQDVVEPDLQAGRLERVLPQWNAPQGICHVVFPSRRGMRPAVRAFIDFLARELPSVS